MYNDSFWLRAKPLIKAINMTQKQFADYLGVPFNTFKNWIQYNRIPDFPTTYNMSVAFGVSVDYLLSGKDRNLAIFRLRELEARKTAADVLEQLENIQKQLRKLRPIPKIQRK
jgi:transcriptional regulator with XRE-family HTH domain